MLAGLAGLAALGTLAVNSRTYRVTEQGHISTPGDRQRAQRPARPGETRAPGRWALLITAIAVILVGALWLWRAAEHPRVNPNETRRITAGASTTQQRAAARALRRGHTLDPAQRPLAAAHVASYQQVDQLTATYICIAASMITVATDNDTVLGWVAPLFRTCSWWAG